MALALIAGVAAVGGCALALVARREHRAVLSARAALFEDCLAVFDTARLGRAADGFPRLDGMIGGRSVRLELIPDSLTLRRLPQLWLSLTVAGRHGASGAFAVLARPVGAEFFAVTHRLAARLEPPALLPAEILARGSGRAGQSLLDAAAEPVAALMADPRTKEVAVTPGTLRAVRQVAQGQRGEYLLLRQSVFPGRVSAADVLGLYDGLIALEDALPASPAAIGATRHEAPR